MRSKFFPIAVAIVISSIIIGCSGMKKVKISIPDKASVKKATEIKAEKSDEMFLPAFQDSKVIYDDKIGFEEFPFVMDEKTVTVVDGNIRRVWFQNPEGKSPLEIIRFYENAVKENSGEIFLKTRNPRSLVIKGKKLADYFKTHRTDRGLSTYVFSHSAFPGEGMTEYLSGKMKSGESEVFVIVASGKGAWAASQQNITYTEIVTIKK